MGRPAMTSVSVGDRIGRLVVLECLGKREAKWGGGLHSINHWRCACDCGIECEVMDYYLRYKKRRSCGCLHKDACVQSLTKHGLSRSRIRQTWRSMCRRCHSDGDRYYADYGGRGIRVCDRWRGSLVDFVADMGEAPNGTTIDRVDNNAGYDCGKCSDCHSRGVFVKNCRWATQEQQANNRRSTVILGIGGVYRSLAQWCDHLGISRWSVYAAPKRGIAYEEAILAALNRLHKKQRMAVSA